MIQENVNHKLIDSFLKAFDINKDDVKCKLDTTELPSFWYSHRKGTVCEQSGRTRMFSVIDNNLVTDAVKLHAGCQLIVHNSSIAEVLKNPKLVVVLHSFDNDIVRWALVEAVDYNSQQSS